MGHTIMKLRFTRYGLTCVLLAISAAATAQAPYPAKPVTTVVPFSTGGSTDLVTRLMGQTMSPSLGQPVVVDNRLGGGGAVGWSHHVAGHQGGIARLVC